MTSKLDQLKQFTTVVADTGDLDAIARLKPVDATTNPSLLLKAAAMPGYSELLKNAVTAGKGNLGLACDHFGVAVGSENLKIVTGRISTEVDARLTFDTQATLRRAEPEIQIELVRCLAYDGQQQGQPLDLSAQSAARGDFACADATRCG